MPNYVTNKIILSGDEKEINNLLERIKTDNQELGTIDFNKIIPMPEDLDIECGSKTDHGIRMLKEMISERMLETGDTEPDWSTVYEWQKQAAQNISKEDVDDWNLGVKALHNIEQYGHPTWYEWCINNWGTKWNSCGFEQGMSGENSFVFQTAWSAPHPIISKLAEMFPNVKILHGWADEDFGFNCGKRTYENGKLISTQLPQSNKEGYEVAAEIIGNSLDEMGLKLNSTGSDYVWCDLEDYKLASLFGDPVLFCEECISDDDIPEGLYSYHLREECDNMYTLEKNVDMGFAGSVISDKEIDFFGQSFILLNESKFHQLYDVGSLSFNDYINRDFVLEQDQTLGGM